MIRRFHTPRAAVLLAALALAGGCHGLTDTIVPPTVVAHEIAWSGNEQNAGVLGIDDRGVHVNADFRDRYNLAVATYGTRPPLHLTQDAGLTADRDGTFHLTDQGFQLWALMCSWRRSARPTN